MHDLVKKVLQHNEPDPARWDQWLMPQPMAAPSQAACMLAAADRIQTAIRNKEKILVAGDYDADGILATAILVEGLRRSGADVGFYIPDRLKEGYGLQPHTVTLAKAKGYSLVVTVDNGIKAQSALSEARKQELDVIVTDHHIMEEEPDADWVVHPDRLEPAFSTLCGAALAFELLRILRLDSAFSLQLAGAASVADMMQVTGQTRALIQKAIHLWNTCRDPHLAALCQEPVWDETTISFHIAPRINAAGRLADRANANNVVRWFLSRKPAEITRFARSLSSLNEERKRLSSQTAQQVCEQLSDSDKIHFVWGEFHEGIVGLAASRIAAERKQPVIVGTCRSGEVRCSMRAPEGYDCAAFVSGFDKFSTAGGHAGAAGFAFPESELEAFRSYVHSQPEYAMTENLDTIDVAASELTVPALLALDSLRPFGPGFRLPAFRLENPRIKSIQDMQGGKHRRYTLFEGLDCLHFNCPADELALGSQDIQAFTGKPQISRFAGRTSASLIVDQAEKRRTHEH